MGKRTALVMHSDCALHDTGWNHPDHQGRLPALTRAVYRDMLSLFDPLLQVEGRHATEGELRLVHGEGYLRRVREWASTAAERGRPIEVERGIVISGATWDAASAAVGSVLAGVDAVLDGSVANAFCAIRPPGAGARPDAAGRFAILNAVAVAARYLTRTRGIAPVLVVDWSGTPGSAIPSIFSADDDVAVVSLAPGEADASMESVPGHATLPIGADVELFKAVLIEALDVATTERTPAFLLLAAGFDILSADPLGELALNPRDAHRLTKTLVEWAERACGGRLVTVLEGGYDATASGEAAVQHLRALAGLDAAD